MEHYKINNKKQETHWKHNQEQKIKSGIIIQKHKEIKKNPEHHTKNKGDLGVSKAQVDLAEQGIAFLLS